MNSTERCALPLLKIWAQTIIWQVTWDWRSRMYAEINSRMEEENGLPWLPYFVKFLNPFPELSELLDSFVSFGLYVVV